VPDVALFLVAFDASSAAEASVDYLFPLPLLQTLKNVAGGLNDANNIAFMSLS